MAAFAPSYIPESAAPPPPSYFPYAPPYVPPPDLGPAPDPDDPALHTPQLDPAWEPDSISGRLDSLGLRDEAAKHNTCGKFGLRVECEGIQPHERNIHSTCRLRGLPCCAGLLLKGNLVRAQKTKWYLRVTRTPKWAKKRLRLYVLQYLVPAVEEAPEAVTRTLDGFRDAFKELDGVAVCLVNAAGFRTVGPRRLLLVRVLLVATERPVSALLHFAVGDAGLPFSVIERKMGRLDDMLELTLTQVIEPTVDRQVNAVKTFLGVRRFRAFYGRKGGKKLLPIDEKPFGNNSDGLTVHTTHAGVGQTPIQYRCPICGAPEHVIIPFGPVERLSKPPATPSPPARTPPGAP